MNTIGIKSAALIALLTASTAYAEQEDIDSSQPAAEQSIQMETQWRKSFQSLDKNRDGVIDQNEAKADKSLNKTFKSIAKKGKLNEQGYLDWQKAQQPRS